MHHATILYEAEGYITTGAKLMGRQSAGEGFLRAAAQSGAERLLCHTSSSGSATHFAGQLTRHGFKGQAGWVSFADHAALAGEGCLYLPGPNVAEFGWRRAGASDRAYSICGLTHTIASHVAMTSITDLLTGPVYSWDALICTSTAVRDTVRFMLERQADYLRARLNATRFELPQLPIIPLGVHGSDYTFSADDRGLARQSLGISANEVVVLFVGRLSFHAKAHPQQMYTALERAARGRNIRLIEYGQYSNPHIEQAFKDGARTLCPSVNVQWLNGRDFQLGKQAWAAADIFISLSDNIQESFGLTPLEAMAAGLPVIVTDWDGYKDTVRDGIDGFRIPTLLPPAPLGQELARRYESGEDSYDMYCGHTSQLTAVDPMALEAAIVRLTDDPSMRKRMGDAGQQRIRHLYDWSVIYRRYQTLWSELAERRRADPDLHPRSRTTIRPDRADPFAAFAGYSTSLLSDDHLVTSLDGGAATLATRRALAMNAFAKHVHLEEVDCITLFTILAERAPRTVREIVSAFPPERRVAIARGLVWLAKMEAVRITPPTYCSVAANIQ